jgi:hypothetical protein
VCTDIPVLDRIKEKITVSLKKNYIKCVNESVMTSTGEREMRTELWWRNVGKKPFGKIGVYVMINFKHMLKNKMLELGLD